MKKYTLLISIALITLFLASCGNGLTTDNTVPQDKAKITLNLGLSDSARNYYPAETDYDLTKFYSYTLKITDKAKPNEDPWTPIVNFTYSVVKGWSSEINPGTYDFELIALKKAYNGSDIVSFSASCNAVKLNAGDSKELSFVLKPEETNLEGKLDLKFHFNNLRGTADYNIGYIDLLLTPLWGQTELFEASFNIGHDFTNTTDEKLGFEKVLPQGLYKVQVNFYANNNKFLLDSYLFLGIGIESGFVTDIEETIKLNPIYDITFEDELEEINCNNLYTKYSRLSPEINFSTSIGSSSSSYKFLGWYDASDSNKTIITSIPKGSTGNRVLKAKWEQYHTITYSSAHGNKPKDIRVEHGTEIVLDSDEIPILADDEENGWVFKGWKLNGNQIKEGQEYKVTGDIVLEALWNKLHTVTYSTDHGDTPDSITLEDGDLLITEYLPELSEEGWVFKGWKLSGVLVSVEEGEESEVTDDIQLVAYWEKVSGSISADIGLDIPTETLYIKNMGNSEDGITLKAMDSDGTSYTSYTWFVEGIELSDETGYLLEYDPTEDGYETDDVLSIMVLAIDENERVHSCTIQVVVQ